MLAVSPFESHQDERLFPPAASQYLPDRPGLACPHSRLHEVAGVGGIAGIVFGGGRYRSAAAAVVAAVLYISVSSECPHHSCAAFHTRR